MGAIRMRVQTADKKHHRNLKVIHTTPAVKHFNCSDCFCIKTVHDLCIFLSWFRRGDFSVEKATSKLMINVFITNMQLFTLPMLIDGLESVCITCGLLWCFYQLFGTLILTAPIHCRDPLVSKWCNAKFIQICSDKETNSSTSWMAWGWVNFLQIFILGKRF